MSDSKAKRDVMPMGGWQSCLPPVRRVRLQASVEAPAMPADTTVAFDAAVFVAFGGSRTAARQAIAHGQYAVDGAIVRDPDARLAPTATVTTVAQLAAELTERFPALVASMKNHDWYYDFSDDRDAWRRGKASHEKIEAALDALPDADARALRSVFGR